MFVHVFGSKSCPSCSNYSLKRTAIDNKDTHRVEISLNPHQIIPIKYPYQKFLCLWRSLSVKPETAAIKLIKDMKGMFQAGGFSVAKLLLIAK